MTTSTLTPRQTFRETVAAVADQARAILPEAVNGRLESAVKLVLQGDVLCLDDGTIEVGSSDPTRVYKLVGANCTCKDFVERHAPGEWCKHRIAANIHRSVEKVLARSQTPEPEAHTEVDDWPEEPEDASLARTEECPAAQDTATGVAVGVAQDPIERSAQIGALMGALARAQTHMSNPGFDATNPHFRNRYASLATVRDAVLPALSAEGIAVTQLPTTPAAGWVAVTTGLWHSSGQYLCTTLRLPVPKADPQGYGSAITYARRYALQALVCVAGDEDDDAESLRTTGQARGK